MDNLWIDRAYGLSRQPLLRHEAFEHRVEWLRLLQLRSCADVTDGETPPADIGHDVIGHAARRHKEQNGDDKAKTHGRFKFPEDSVLPGSTVTVPA